MDLRHVLIQEAGDFKILLQDLLTGSEITNENWNQQLIAVLTFTALNILPSIVKL